MADATLTAPVMCCGIRVSNTCPVCGAENLYARYLSEVGLDTAPVGDPTTVGGLAGDEADVAGEEKAPRKKGSK